MARSLDTHVRAMEAAMGVKFKDRAGVATAMRGMVDSCTGDDDGEENEDQGKGKGLPSIGLILSKSRGK